MTKVLELKIAVVVTVQNFKLFNRTKNSIPPGIDLFVVDGRYGFYALNALQLVFSSDQVAKYEWIIMADEDVIFIDFDSILELIHHMKNNDHQLAGVSDGSALEFRKGDPTIPNLFFCVFNNYSIRSKFDLPDFNQYVKTKSNTGHEPSKVMNESYYLFFKYLFYHGFKIMFLNAHNKVIPGDYESTFVYNHLNKIMLIHTWYARLYLKNQFHTARINHVVNSHLSNQHNKTYFNLKNPQHFHFKKQFYLKFLKKKIKRFILMK